MRIHFRSRSSFGCVLLVSLLFLFSASANQAMAGQDDSKQFQERIQQYLALHKKAAGSVPALRKEVSDAAQIANRQQRLAEAIRALRPHAMPGEIFTPGVKQMIVSAVKQKVDGKDGDGAKSTILGEGNPKNPESPTPVNLTVNAIYPTTAPLSTMPPSVLMALPTLPKELEYRFVGKTLILRDTEANLIVDVLPNAF